MKDKLFITGLALGIDNDACQCSNFNVNWLFTHPSTLLWAKKIVVSKTIFKIIKDGHASSELKSGKQDEMSLAIKMIFELLDSYGMIDVVDTSRIITKELQEQIYSSIDEDLKLLAVENDESGCIIKDKNGYSYCIPKLWTAYASIIYSRLLNARCLSNESDLNFFKFKFENGSEYAKELKHKPEVFQKLFDVYLPNEPIAHPYLFDYKTQCIVCKNEKECKDNYLIDIEKNIHKIVRLREQDEVQEIISIINRIYESVDRADYESDIIDVRRSFELVITKTNKKLKRTMPQVKQWTTLSTIVSIPITLAGLVTNQNDLAMSGAALAASLKVFDEYLKYYDGKFKWVNNLIK